ncbi:hypothetical protein BKA82DRAFT_4016281 [Pisolithus tinctorius]|nr:hypothetical protein BKA82DRAFT_4016281 [Pisolithus tinctorius]
MFAHFSSSLHLYSLLINPMPGECLLSKAWSLQELSWYGLAVGHMDETPSDGGATSYSTTRGIEDCQLSLATLESIFYFPKETQLFTLPAGTLIGILLLAFLLSWLTQHSLHHLLRPMVFCGYPQLHLLLLRQDSIHFAHCYPQFHLLLLILESFQFALCTFSSTSIMPGERLDIPFILQAGMLIKSSHLSQCCLCFRHGELQRMIFFTWGIQ